VGDAAGRGDRHPQQPGAQRRQRRRRLSHRRKHGSRVQRDR
jgi:hypothetical protein